jgi:hypothetical protein
LPTWHPWCQILQNWHPEKGFGTKKFCLASRPKSGIFWHPGKNPAKPENLCSKLMEKNEISSHFWFGGKQ